MRVDPLLFLVLSAVVCVLLARLLMLRFEPSDGIQDLAVVESDRPKAQRHPGFGAAAGLLLRCVHALSSTMRVRPESYSHFLTL